MVALSGLPWSLSVALLAIPAVSGTPLVNVGMKAAFPSPPYLLELLETAAAENSTSYFPILDRIASGHFSSANSDADLLHLFLDVLHDDGHITSPEAISTFHLALALRTASPRIEAQYQYYESTVEPVAGELGGCRAWFSLGDGRRCKPFLDGPADNAGFSNVRNDLPFDRATGTGREAVLYADPTSESFGPLHRTLREAAFKGQLRYKLRYRRAEGSSSSGLPLSGYGVELALKRTDYIVIDDREAGRGEPQEPLASEVLLDEAEEFADLKPLSTSELVGLGLKAASFVMQSENPLETLVKLTQDLPKYTTSIAAHEISTTFLSEHTTNRERMAPSGINYLWMNGVQLVERQIEPFTLVEMVRQERNFLSGVRRLGFSGKQAVSLLGHPEVAAAKAGVGSPRFDWTDRSEQGKVIIWLNDLEVDQRYVDYPRSLKSMLQRTYPGQLPPIGRNVFNVVFPVDLTDPEDIGLVSMVIMLMRRGIPIRFGLVPLASNQEASLRAKVAYYLSSDLGSEASIAYLSALRDDMGLQILERLVFNVVDSHGAPSKTPAKSLKEIAEAEAYSQHISLAQQWLQRLSAETTVRPIFADGVALPRDQNWMQAVSMKLAEDLQAIQAGLIDGTVDEDAWPPGILLGEAHARRNAYIVPEDDSALKFVDISKIIVEHSDLMEIVPVLKSSHGSARETWGVLSIVSNLATQAGRELLLSALSFKRKHPGLRVDIIHNPAPGTTTHQLNAALRANEERLNQLKTIAELEAVLDEQQGSEGSGDFETALERFIAAANLHRGDQALLLNGRVIGPISPDASFEEDDFQQLLEFERVHRIYPVYAAADDLGLGDKLTDAMSAAKVTSLTALSTVSDLPEGIFESAPKRRTTIYDEWETNFTAIEIGDPENASIHLVGLLNPLTEQGQKRAPILKVLSELDGVYLKLFINPKENISELPVKRFFRYVLDSKPTFDQDGNLKALNATFKSLPTEALLTAGISVPPAWLVAPEVSMHDLDNIKLSATQGDVEAMYELEHILIEGHSREGSGAPPRGAQLVLATGSNTLLTDTIIMSNLGYFQFKANPGCYDIRMKQGTSAEIFSIESVGADGWGPVPGDEGTDVVVLDFQGTTLYPRLRRNPGMETADVLEDANETGGSIVSKGLKLAGGLFGGSKDSSNSKEHAEINIFSVASGHLYERMLNIMILSVMRNTKHTVKFWFIEQFLSPSFKDFIPYMAEEYGFQYEMVTYKWPHWLRQQREKQREIWGYKILFLDVLFPLSLDKVIFVDADQIVRTDMIDLVNHDLQGAPYGFAPMCDSRTEMEGFRFWKQGYWFNFLRGKPYHISALYVVDLRRFRALAAGDRLRQQYQSLSADPNSLSNLDQDLPNNMQFKIPIHSLPQEWLWCETWCSEESLADARTIDLCNNPQTKEPKLDRAKRQVPEWTMYDDEISALNRRRRGIGSAPEALLSSSSGSLNNVNTKSRRFEGEIHTKDEL